ncbi:Hypothetical protein SMB2099_3805 [Serratia marcescens SMB2099]|nr:Hypothetical protein SMB2099_3805 [Serratia marcescens SMB2099]
MCSRRFAVFTGMSCGPQVSGIAGEKMAFALLRRHYSKAKAMKL